MAPWCRLRAAAPYKAIFRAAIAHERSFPGWMIDRSKYLLSLGRLTGASTQEWNCNIAVNLVGTGRYWPVAGSRRCKAASVCSDARVTFPLALCARRVGNLASRPRRPPRAAHGPTMVATGITGGGGGRLVVDAGTGRRRA